jgi:hypothetical protein
MLCQVPRNGEAAQRCAPCHISGTLMQFLLGAGSQQLCWAALWRREVYRAGVCVGGACQELKASAYKWLKAVRSFCITLIPNALH